MKLSEKAIEKINSNPKVISELIMETRKSYPTIRRWITNSDVQLTRKGCINVLVEQTGLTEKEIFEPETEKAG